MARYLVYLGRSSDAVSIVLFGKKEIGKLPKLEQRHMLVPKKLHKMVKKKEERKRR